MKAMDPFEEIRYLGWDLEDVDDFENSPSHSTLSERLKKTLYLTEGCGTGMSLPVADTAVELFQEASGSPLDEISPRHVANLSKRSRVAPCTLLLAMIYARRLKTMNEDYLENMTAQDLLLVSMMVASKFLYDEGEVEEMFSDEWASAANVDLKRVYELEREFLSAMDWNLFVHNKEFYGFVRDFETRIALSQGIRRGWFSYSDMEILMAQAGWFISCKVVMQQTLQVVAVCTAVYTVCATTLIWSSLVLRHTPIHGPCPTIWLDSRQVQKSTLMHQPTSYPLSLSEEGCPGIKELTAPELLNGSDIRDRCADGEQVTTDDVAGSTVWELTSTLHRKYHAAQNALAIFYQALITSFHDVGSFKGGSRGCGKNVGRDGVDDEMCACYQSNGNGSNGGCKPGRCVAERLNGTAIDEAASPDGKCCCHSPGCAVIQDPEMNVSSTTQHRCHCQQAPGEGSELPTAHRYIPDRCVEQGTDCCCDGSWCNPEPNCMGHCKAAGGDSRDGPPSVGHSAYLPDTGPPGTGRIGDRGCITPNLAQRFVDFDTRFATISY